MYVCKKEQNTVEVLLNSKIVRKFEIISLNDGAANSIKNDVNISIWNARDIVIFKYIQNNKAKIMIHNYIFRYICTIFND